MVLRPSRGMCTCSYCARILSNGMKFLGIDYGEKRVGIAVSDESATFALPKDVIPNDASMLEKIQLLIEEERIREIVIGDALAEGGGQNQITAKADAFAETLGKLASAPVHRSREAWSSQEAARFAPPGETHNDSAAAAIILQRFLDARPV